MSSRTGEARRSDPRCGWEGLVWTRSLCWGCFSVCSLCWERDAAPARVESPGDGVVEGRDVGRSFDGFLRVLTEGILSSPVAMER